MWKFFTCMYSMIFLSWVRVDRSEHRRVVDSHKRRKYTSRRYRNTILSTPHVLCVWESFTNNTKQNIKSDTGLSMEWFLPECTICRVSTLVQTSIWKMNAVMNIILWLVVCYALNYQKLHYFNEECICYVYCGFWNWVIRP